jgi:hypothetical protein
LDSFHRYDGPFTKTCEAGVYDGGGAHGLPCARGPYVPRTCGRVRGVLHGILCAGIQYTIASVPSLVVIALWPRAAPSDPLGGLAYIDLNDSVQCLPGD